MATEYGALLPESQNSHADICIYVGEFDGVHYEVVGFLQDREDHVLGEKAIQRAGNNVVRSDDWERIIRNRDKIPALLDTVYRLATDLPDLVDPADDVLCLCRGSQGWHDGCLSLLHWWKRDVLILRRRV